jgi:hypothetical protein
MPRSHPRWLVALAFAGLLSLGLVLYRDYGISWDEESARLSRGLPNFVYLTEGDGDLLERSRGKHHGPAFEIALFFLERTLGLEDSQAIYFTRHLATFLVFFAAVAVFYRVLRRRFHSRWIGLAGAALLVLSPRIFADAFYNNKDVAFLSAYIFSLATLGRFLRRPTMRRAALHALACGFLIAIRVPGVVVPVITAVLVPASWLARRRHGEVPRRSWLSLAWLCGLSMLFTTLFWPALWTNPVQAFGRACEVMRRYPWQGTVFYGGEEIRANELPWHYLPRWILITTPLFHIVLFVVGAGSFVAEGLRRPIDCVARRTLDVAWATALVVPLAVVIGLRATVYDGWRHLYFIYPAFIYMAVLGFTTLLAGVRRCALHVRPAVPIFLVVCAVPLLAVARTMVRDHPYQNLYFNELAGPDMQTIKANYELDYWGLSCRQGLERLLARDSSPIVHIYAETVPVANSLLLLSPEQRARVHLVPHVEQADYYLSHFRKHRAEFPPERDVCAIYVGNAKVFVAQRVEKPQE